MDNKTKKGECSILPIAPEKQIPGVMFVSGYIMAFNNRGDQGIMSVKAGGHKFVIFNKRDMYLNAMKFSDNKKLFDIFNKGAVINVLMNDMGELRFIHTFEVRYQAVFAWTGSLPYVPPYVVQYPQLLANSDTKENTSSFKTYDIITDVPIRNLEEHSGLVYWCCSKYGLVSVRNKSHIINILFTPRVLFLNGVKFPTGENFVVACADKVFSLYAKRISPQKVFGVTVCHEAVMVWRGNKPNMRLVFTVPATETQGRPVLNLTRHRVSRDKADKQESIDSQTPWKKSSENMVENNLSPTPKNDCKVMKLTGETTSPNYLTGMYNGVYNSYFIYGSPEKAAMFEGENFYVDGKTLSTKAEISHYIMSCSTCPILHSYVVPVRKPLKLDKYNIVWEALYVWHGCAPAKLKEQIRALKREPLISPGTSLTWPTVAKDSEVENFVDRKYLVGNENIALAKPIRRGRISGYALTCSASDAILTGFTNCVYFTRERFYVNGRKFRSTSLLEYFQKHNDKVYAYLVPMKATVVRGCVVFSKAVCAWIGKEPEELQQLIINDKKSTNREIDISPRDSKGCFYYFVGRVQKLGEKRGVMQCDVDGECLDVSFSINELYKHGKKVHANNILAIHMNVLMTSRWSLLAYHTNKPVISGVNYIAVAVWHHENQPNLLDEFQNKIPLWLQRLENKKCKCTVQLDKLLKKPFSNIVPGSVTEKREKELAVGVKDKGLVWLDQNHVWVDGCSCYFSNSDEHRMCFIVFGEDEETPLFAYIGQEPNINIDLKCGHQFGVNVSSDHGSDSDDDMEHNDEKYFEDIYEDSDDIGSSSDDDIDDSLDMTNLADPYELIQVTTRNSYSLLLPSKSKKTSKRKNSELRNFCGRYVTGSLVSINGDSAIASWRSTEFCGTIFIVMDVNYLFINTVAYSKMNPSVQANDRMWKDRACYMYINTLLEVEWQGLLQACARATVGWIGTKPVFVPSPGLQKQGIFEKGHLRIAFSETPDDPLDFCTLEQWNYRLKKELLRKGKELERKEQKLYNVNNLVEKLTSSNPVSLQTQPIHNELSPEQIRKFTSLSLSTKVATQIYTTSDFDMTNKQVLDLLCPPHPSLSNTAVSASIPVGSLMTQTNKEVLQGKVLELHPTLGRLVGCDRTSHYFKPDQFFLHGVCLQGMELYCVLVQGLLVEYRLDCEGRLDQAWYGCRVAQSQEQAASDILLWCEANLVPEETQAALLLGVSRL